MTRHEREVARALGRCSFLPGSWEKRFAQDMADRADAAAAERTAISGRQALCLERLAWKFRNQMPRHLVPDAEPPELPPRGKQPTKVTKKLPRRRRGGVGGGELTADAIEDAVAAMRAVA